jgi:hypothetical protein
MDCNHNWVVFSTALEEGWLMVQCLTCAAGGTVDDPSAAEWRAAFHAPSRPYRWTYPARVTLRVPPGSALYVESVNGEPIPSSRWKTFQARNKK